MVRTGRGKGKRGKAGATASMCRLGQAGGFGRTVSQCRKGLHAEREYSYWWLLYVRVAPLRPCVIHRLQFRSSTLLSS